MHCLMYNDTEYEFFKYGKLMDHLNVYIPNININTEYQKIYNLL